MAPFYGWGSTASRLEPLRGGSLLFTTKFPEISGTHFIDLGRLTVESTLEPLSGFEQGNPRLGIQRLNHSYTSFVLKTVKKTSLPPFLSISFFQENVTSSSFWLIFGDSLASFDKREFSL